MVSMSAPSKRNTRKRTVLPIRGAWSKVMESGVAMQRSVAPMVGAKPVADIAEMTSKGAGEVEGRRPFFLHVGGGRVAAGPPRNNHIAAALHRQARRLRLPGNDGRRRGIVNKRSGELAFGRKVGPADAKGKIIKRGVGRWV